jgi:hypothetical protein
MTEADREKGQVRDTQGDTGILANLSRTRPQRSSPRRAAARAASAQKAPPRQAPRQAKVRQPGVEPVPKQGFESESDSLSGSVKPPGGTELVVSVAEIAGELAKAGLSTGERLLKDALSRLTRSD